MAHPTEKDIESLNRFWQWADNEKPDPTLFMQKAGVMGPLTEEAQEALDVADEVLSARLPEGFAVPTETWRSALKSLSLATLYSWMVLPEAPPALVVHDPLNIADVLKYMGDGQVNLTGVDMHRRAVLLAQAEQDFSEDMHREAYAKSTSNVHPSPVR